MAKKMKVTSEFKAKVAIEALKENKTLEELAREYKVLPAKITEWKNEFVKNAAQAFEKPTEGRSRQKQLEKDNERLCKKVGELTMACDFFAQACADAGLKVR